MLTLGLKDPAFLARSVAAGGPTFFPSDIAGLIRWYKAEDYAGSYSDGDPITTDWLDNSASLEDAIPDAGNEPTYKDTQLSAGRSSVQFGNGVKHFDTTLMSLGNFSVIAFWKPNADSIIASSTPGNWQIRELSGGIITDHPQIFANGPPALDATNGFDVSVWHARAWTRAGGSGVPFFYYNKNQEPEDTGETNTTNFEISTIGLFNGGPANFDLAEICIYNAVLTQTDIDNLYDGYWSIRYAGDI